MRRSVAGLRVFLAGGVVAWTGCGPGEFAPPPQLVATPNTTTSSLAKVVYLVLPGPADADSDALTWVLAGQSEAERQRAIFRVVGPESGASADRQAEAIRKAIAEGASALVVVPHDLRALAPVLAEAEAKRVAVVTLGAAVPADPPLPGSAVVPEPFAASAASLVRAAIEDARGLGHPADPPAVILLARHGDRFSADRVAALSAAAREAGLTHLEPLGFEVIGQADGRIEALKVLSDHLAKHPDTAIVLAEGDEAMAAASRARSQSKAEKPIVVAGYIGFRGQTDPASLRGSSAFVEGKLDVLTRLAVRTALARSRGEPVATTTVMPTPLSRSIGQAIWGEGPAPGADSPKQGPPGARPAQP